MNRWRKRIGVSVAALGLAAAAAAVGAQELKLGYFNSERILRDSVPAKAASTKLEAEFAKRDRELQEAGAKVKAAAERLEKESLVLSESDRAKRQRELAEMDRDFQRKQREFREDLNQRRNEELQGLLERTQRVVRQIADQEKYDLVVGDAVYFSPRVDITDKVLRALNSPK